MALRPAIRLLGALLLLAPGDAAAEWKEAHKLGVAAVNAGRWEDAERFFRAAVAERPAEKVNRLRTYLPHYYLGVALAERGDCRSALESFAESTRQGQIEKADKQAADLNRREERCRNHLRQIEAAAAEVEKLLEQVTEAADSLATLSRTAELAAVWDAGEPSFSSRQSGADSQLEEARRLLREGRDRFDLDRLDRAKTLATQSMSAVEACVAAARARLGELNTATAGALEQVQETEQSARRVLRSISDLAPYPRQLGLKAATVERTLELIVERKAGAGANELEVLREELTVALTALRRAARRPPKKLNQAAEAFFGGELETALELLRDVDFSRDLRARSHACLLRAASRHALWVLDGERDEELVALAARDLTACEATKPPAPSSKFFSPRFVEFHRATLAAEALDSVESTASAVIDETVTGITETGTEGSS